MTTSFATEGVRAPLALSAVSVVVDVVVVVFPQPVEAHSPDAEPAYGGPTLHGQLLGHVPELSDQYLSVLFHAQTHD